MKSQLFGRDAEIRILDEAFQRISTEPHERREGGVSELVLIHGKSGSGKTEIVLALKDLLRSRRPSSQSNEANPFLFSMGKFDQLQWSLPYQAVVDAIDDLLNQIQRDTRILESVRDRIQVSMRPQLQHLLQLFPTLKSFVDEEKQSTKPRDQGLRASQALSRLKVMCRSLFRTICHPSHPVILFLDDIQWADDGSLAIIKSLLSDRLSRHLLIICSYRDDEMKAEKLERYFSGDIGSRSGSVDTGVTDISGSFMVSVTDISLRDLDLEQVNAMVSDRLQANESDMWELSKIVLNKTRGNPYFITQFLDLLHAKGLVGADADGSLSFKLVDIQNVVSDSVVQVLTAKVKTLPPLVQKTLLIASLLGSRFRIRVLELVSLEELNKTDSGELSTATSPLHQERVRSSLGLALKEGLVRRIGDSEYQFFHDRVQQCAQLLAKDEADRELLHLHIGMVLWNEHGKADASEFNETTILAIDSLNRGSAQIVDGQQRIDLVALNLAAARWATKKSAPYSAVRYIRSGVALLDEASWDSQYELTLELHSVGAQLEHATGSFVRCNIMIAAIHRHAKSLDDRLAAWLTEVDALASRGEIEKSVCLTCSILRRIGCKLPPKPSKFHVILEILGANRTVKRLSDDGILALERNSDRRVQVKLKLLSSLKMTAFAGDTNKNLPITAALRELRITCQYGLEPTSVSSFASYGGVKAFLGDKDFGSRYSRLSLKLVDKHGLEEVRCRTVYTSYSFGLLFTTPLPEGRDIFQRMYHVGLANGDIDHAYLSAHVSAGICILVGADLGDLDTFCRKICLEMEEFQLNWTRTLTLVTWQFAINYLGRCNDPAILSGEATDRAVVDEIKASRHHVALATLRRYELMLLYTFQKWGAAARKLSELETVLDALNGHFTHVFAMTTLGLAAFALYRETGKRRYKVVGKRGLRYFSQLSRRGCRYADGLLALMQAEAMSAAKACLRDAAEEAYLNAIQLLKDAHLVDLHGIALERLALTLIKHADTTAAQTYIQQSIEIYEEWGATAKVEWMKQRYNDL